MKHFGFKLLTVLGAPSCFATFSSAADLNATFTTAAQIVCDSVTAASCSLYDPSAAGAGSLNSPLLSRCVNCEEEIGEKC